jgi:hypothetical protein
MNHSQPEDRELHSASASPLGRGWTSGGRGGSCERDRAAQQTPQVELRPMQDNGVRRYRAIRSHYRCDLPAPVVGCRLGDRAAIDVVHNQVHPMMLPAMSRRPRRDRDPNRTAANPQPRLDDGPVMPPRDCALIMPQCILFRLSSDRPCDREQVGPTA